LQTNGDGFFGSGNSGVLLKATLILSHTHQDKLPDMAAYRYTFKKSAGLMINGSFGISPEICFARPSPLYLGINFIQGHF
jgi:hypothetical protein